MTFPPLVDSHCHLTHGRFAGDLAETVARAQAAGLWRMVLIGTGVADAQAGLALQERFPEALACAAGLDPFSCHEAGDRFDAELAALRALLQQRRHVALGEIGLEYHHTLNPHPVQARQLEAQLDLAAELGLPAILHIRDAHHDMLPLLQGRSARGGRDRGIVHSFIGDAAQARGYLDLGWSLAFNGTVTYKGNGFLRDAARIVPADRILVETDSPYLAPVPMRGKRCEPAHVAHTLEALAELRGERAEDLAAWTTRNAALIFGWPPPW